MDIRKFITAALLLVLGAAPLQAQQDTPPAQTQQQNAAEHPFYDTGFYPAWSQMTPEAALADVQEGIRLAQARLEAICAIEPGQETWENVFVALDDFHKELSNTATYWSHLTMVTRNAKLQQAHEQIMPLLSQFEAAATADERVRAVVQRAAEQPWAQELSPAKRRHMLQIVEMFSEGAGLTPEQKARREEMTTEMFQLQNQYDLNLTDSAYEWTHEIKDAAELAGMPEKWLQSTGYGEQGSRCWTINPGDSTDILQNCSVEATRRIAWEGRNVIGNCEGFDNAPIVLRVMELRQELAVLAGYKNFADQACKWRMVDDGDKALAFVDDLMDQLRPAYHRECQEILDCIAATTGEVRESLNPWDIQYYSALLARERHQFDPESVRPYFRSDNVQKAMFAVATQLYGISFTERKTAYVRPGRTCPEDAVEVWNTTVRVFEVTDDKTGAKLGAFYYDAYTRFGKQWGAWTGILRPGEPGVDGSPHEPHLAVMVTNFPSGGRHKGYTLLSQEEVTTLFHEFGHMLHSMLSDPEVRDSGVNIALDLAELPSQLFENWAWEPEIIATYAFHHETGEPMPQELVEQLVSQRYFMPATANMEKLFMAKLDLEMHMHYATEFAGKQLDEASAKVTAPWSFPMSAQAPSSMRLCAHCISRSYAAGYFCYNWADVLAADAFTRFKKEGLLNPETGAAFRNCILKRGDDAPAAELYRDFMGRDPNPDALLEKQGLK